MNFISTVYAQASVATPSTPAPQGGLLGMLVPFALIFVIFYFLIFRPQQKQQKRKAQMIANLKRGDDVVMENGIYGKITDINNGHVMVQVTNNVTLKVDRARIGVVLSPAENKSH